FCRASATVYSLPNVWRASCAPGGPGPPRDPLRDQESHSPFAFGCGSLWCARCGEACPGTDPRGGAGPGAHPTSSSAQRSTRPQVVTRDAIQVSELQPAEVHPSRKCLTVG